MKRVISLVLLLLLLTGCAANVPPASVPTTEPEQPSTSGFPGLGGVMPEMTFNIGDGETQTLSQLLEEKELVVLNYWFEDCPWCVQEFSVMEVSYQRYRQDVEVVALNPVDGAEAVEAFQQRRGLSFLMAACPRSWAVEYGVRAYPTSIFIDRDGVVCLIHTGAITATEDWDAIFDAFTGEDYQRRVYGKLDELLR